MSVITIPISDKNREVLQLLAERAGKSAEEFLQAQIEELLTANNKEFSQTADYVLKKNAELYRRLS